MAQDYTAGEKRMDATNIQDARRGDVERTLADARRAQAVLSAISDAVITLDRDFRIIFVNQEAARINKKPAEAFLGRLHWDEWPASIGTNFETQFRRAMTERVTLRFLERYYVPGEYDDWIDITVYPAADEDGGGLHLVYRDVSARVGRERRERFLAELAERVRTLTAPDAIIADTVRSVGRFLDLSRCTFVDIDVENDVCTVRLDYCADDVASIAGVLPWSAFGPAVSSQLEAGRAVVVNDVRGDGDQVPSRYVAAYDTIGVRSHLTVPVVHSTRLVSCLSAQSASPRLWQPEEVELLRQVVERTWLTVTLARQQRALREEVEQRREQGEYLRRLIESSPDCIKTLDLNGHLLTMTEGGQKIMEVANFADVCGLNWLTFWQSDDRMAVQAAVAVAKAGATGRFQGFSPTLQGTPKWWDVTVTPILSADGKPEQLLAVSRDITDQKQAADRERTRLTSIFMQAPAFMAALRGPNHVFELANPPYYQLVGRRDIIGNSVADALPEVVEQGFIGLLDQVYRTGQSVAGKDVRLLLQVEASSPLEERWVDFSYQPLFDEDGAVSGTLVHGIDLTERKRLEQERERLLAQAQARAEREALINQIGEAVRAALEPAEVQAVAVAALGQALRADRCYYVTYDMARDRARIGRDWRRDGLPSITGEYRTSDYVVNREGGYHSGRTQVIEDVYEHLRAVSDDRDGRGKSLMDSLGLRSFIRAPLVSNGTVTALVVAMSGGPRSWGEDEVRLVETVTAQTRAAVEATRAQQRERNIAQQLQDALLPTLPPSVPGLILHGFYRPALDEAGVGGDFMDAAQIGPDSGYLCVADLSGKGLAAAQQVALVKNMMRYALHTSATLADAVTSVDQVLVRQNLLTGFATLFVGVYDASARALTYVNAGQEPGLLFRAETGTVEYLFPTGPVLGGMESTSGHREKTVLLSPGDVLALFTDGLTEVGPSRKELLEVEGVSDLFHDCCTNLSRMLTPELVIERLIAGVDGFARGGARDDIALLVGVVGSEADTDTHFTSAN